MFTLPNLPYSYEALEPHFDATTMRIHHTKHHQTYVDKLNAALTDEYSQLRQKSVVQLLLDFEQVPDAIKTPVRNHAGGHANHSLFWTILSPNGGGVPTGAMAEAIEAAFGDFGTFKEAFTTAATNHFGSGWAWLVKDADRKLQIITTPNQDSPLMTGLHPIMGVDVWEHAYYLKYQNRRPDYLQAFWNVVSWSAVAEQFGS